MDKQNTENTNDKWLDEILGKQHTARQISFDEAALSAAGLMHPDEAELEKIVQETMAENWGEPEQSVPQETATVQSAGTEDQATQFFAPQDVPPRETPRKPQEKKKPAASQPKRETPTEETEKEATEMSEKKTFLSRLWSGYGLFGIPHILSTFIWAILIIAIGTWLGRTGWLCASDLLALGKEGQAATITVDEADLAGPDRMDVIAGKLEEAGLIRYPTLFKMFAELTGKGDNILVGSITFSDATVYDYNALINAMSYRGGSIVTVDVMIPEGYSCAQIFELLEEKGVCSVSELEKYAAEGELDKYWFLEGLERGHKYCLEGYLFPDTYQFYMDDEPRRVLEKFLDNFHHRFTNRMVDKFVALNNKTGLNLSLHEVIIMASIVEKEKAADGEGYKISSVFYNRLVNASTYPFLNSDATILYATDYYNKGELITRDQINASPYNTYTQTGLPPTPIANPGLSSLDAALDPETTDYFYFILDRSAGAHRFSRTLAEHERLERELGYK